VDVAHLHRRVLVVQCPGHRDVEVEPVLGFL
jgi:hypothetical protein